MSAIEPPPPTPGTWPLLRRGRKPTLRPFREDAAIAQAARARGAERYTDGRRRARVEAVAHDLAAVEPPDDAPLRPAIRDELVATIRVNVAQAAADQARARAAANGAAEQAEVAAANAARAERAADRALRRARSEVPEAPVSGGHVAWPWLPLLVAPVLMYLELQVGAPSLEAALDVGTREAQSVALMLALGLTIAAEGLGLSLAALVKPSRAATRWLLGLFVVGVLACGAWTVVTLSASRDRNLVYREAVRTVARGGGTASVPGLGSLVRGGTRSSAEQQARDAEAAVERAQELARAQRIKDRGPDLGFMAPLILLSMLTGAVLAARAALAADWRKATRRAAAAEEAFEQAQTASAAAELERRRALERLVEADVGLMGVAERETATVAQLLDHFREEYRRWCARFGMRPRDLILPPPPPAREAIEPVIYPDHVWYTMPRPSADGGVANGAAAGARPPVGGMPPRPNSGPERPADDGGSDGDGTSSGDGLRRRRFWRRSARGAGGAGGDEGSAPDAEGPAAADSGPGDPPAEDAAPQDEAAADERARDRGAEAAGRARRRRLPGTPAGYAWLDQDDEPASEPPDSGDPPSTNGTPTPVEDP
jgi:hypothetical protein